jgi:reactive chlorine resistance protein C
MDKAGQIVEASTERMLVEAPDRMVPSAYLEKLGIHISRYGLVVTLLLIGILKFTSAEAQGIQPLVASSPLMFWLYHIFSLQTVSNLIGATEIVVAVLIALRPVSARLSLVGSVGAVITFLLTVSFLFSTPGAFQFSHGLPLLGDAGQFLIKDLVLLGAAFWTAAEAQRALLAVQVVDF